METTVDELPALADSGATILNVGARGGHREIRGAVRYRPRDLLTPEHLAIPIAPDGPVVLYDEDGGGELTGQDRRQAAGRRLRRRPRPAGRVRRLGTRRRRHPGALDRAGCAAGCRVGSPGAGPPDLGASPRLGGGLRRRLAARGEVEQAAQEPESEDAR